jgi:hypothetical protein
MKAFPAIGTGVALGARTTALFPESERLSPNTYSAEYPATAFEAKADEISAKSQQMARVFTGVPLYRERAIAINHTMQPTLTGEKNRSYSRY